jgi:predicted ATPase/DNA-binding CsgD family transcriptional regulator
VTGTVSLVDAGVSEREAEVFALLGERLTHAQIGARLFISVRTVESHVASLRRKLRLADRAALVRLAVDQQARSSARTALSTALPTPLTPFVGRARELVELATAITNSRLVSAVGPGGVGKTRLALAAAATLTDRFAGGVGYVDLVPVTDPTLVPAAVATALDAGPGSGGVAGHTTEDVLVAGVGDVDLLLVLDNCEHIVDAAARLAELLLSRCAGLRLLVTSRTRLVLPFERVYQVPGLSTHSDRDDSDSNSEGDAITLFRTRAAAIGSPVTDTARAATICQALDGSALAIELAAARLPSLGLDGLERGLADHPSDHLGLLTGGQRLQQRHRSLRDTLDWSYHLLDPTDQAILRRISVFAAPFDLDAATDVTADAFGGGSDTPAALARSLARLAEHSLVAVIPHRDGTRYRLLETVRQYGTEQLHATSDPAYPRHLDWCLRTATRLTDNPTIDNATIHGTNTDEAAWTAPFDRVADDLRAALGWAAEHQRDRGRHLADLLGGLLFRRGQLGEAQRRYEQAANLAADPHRAAASLARAAAVAKCRLLGEDALRLERACAQAHLHAGDPAAAAVATARCVELGFRFRGMFAHPPTADESTAMSAEARHHAAGDWRADATLVAAWANADATPNDPAMADLLEQALHAARENGAHLLESSLLDARMLRQLNAGAITEAAATARHRVELVRTLPPHDPATAFELKDTLHGAVFTTVGAGDLTTACQLATFHTNLPFLRHERDLAAEDALYPLALAGRFTDALALATGYREAWESAGRRVAPGRGIGPAAIAMVHDILGDTDGRAEWLAILTRIRGIPTQTTTDTATDSATNTATAGSGYGEVFDAIALLHHGYAAEAFAELVNAEDKAWRFFGTLFHQWRAALRAEAAVLAHHHDAPAELNRAADLVTDNPIATAILRRAHALHTSDPDTIRATADDFDRAGCPYQRDRSTNLADNTTPARHEPMPDGSIP